MCWGTIALTSLLAVAPEARIGFVGDVNFGWRLDPPERVLAAVVPHLAAPDLTLANAEGLLLAEPAPPYRDAQLDISAHPRYAAAFAGSGIDLVGSANNHAWDDGADGLLEHLGHLAGVADVATFGAASDDSAYAPVRYASAAGCLSFVPAALASNRGARPGAHVALYGRPGGAPLVALYERVAGERAAGCAPIVYVHWGREGRPRPDAAVVAVGHALVDAGAALVVGHHPHVVQGFAHYRGALIAWSLGNFVFKNRDPDTRRTGLLEVNFARARDGDAAPAHVSAAAFVPMTIDTRDFAPRPATGREIEAHLAELARRSAGMHTRLVRDGDRLALVPDPE